MMKKRNHIKNNEFYFCTITCYNWLNLISQTNIYDEIYDMFDILNGKGCLIAGYVIMPNHFHFLEYQTELAPSLNKVVGNGKRFLAYDIIERLQDTDQVKTLKHLRNSVNDKMKLRGQKHRVFNDSFDASICENEYDIEHVLDYMHYNPASGKWNLIEHYINYVHSSARFYELGENTGYKNIIDYRDIIHGRL